jgi:hypothetical protein
MGATGDGGKLGLEGVDLRPEWGDPAPVEGAVYRLPILGSDVRWGEIDPAQWWPRG